MKYIKKLIIPFVILVILFTAIITRSCINKDKNVQGDIVFWAKNDSNPTQQRIYNNAIKKFNEYYPDVTITIRQFDDYSKIYDAVLLNSPTKTTPNICISYPDHVATYLKKDGNILNLSKYIDDPEYGFGGSKVPFQTKKNNINLTYLNEGYIDDKLYLLPFMRSSEATYVNLDYLESLGYECPEVLTWDFVWEVCEKAREQNTATNFWPMMYKSEDNMFIHLTYQNDYGYTDKDGNILFFNDNVTNMLLDLSDKASRNLYSTFTCSSYPGNFFNKGNCIFAIDSTAGSTWMGSNCPLLDIDESEVKQFRTKVMNVPQVDINNQKMISQGPSLCLFDKGDYDINLTAWLFAQFLLSDEVQLEYSKTEGYLPVTTSAIESKNFLDYLNDSNEYEVKRDATKLILNNVNHMFITPVFDGSANVRSAAKYIGSAVAAVNYTTPEKIQGLYLKAIKNNGLNDFIIDDTTINVDEKKNSIVAPLLIILGIVWLLIGLYVIYDKKKYRKR